MFQVKAMEFYDNNQKCMIPFDSKDLSLLPHLNVSPKHYNNIMPLWSMNNLHLRKEDCYYEFEVIQSDNSTDCKKNSSCTDSSYTESNVESSDFAKEMCHICNMKVPTVCMSEHLSSTKHSTFSKIAEISLERVKRQMGVTYKCHRPPAGYLYCDSCVDLVPEGDLRQHRKSKSHRNAQLIDRLLLDLLSIYSDESGANSEDDSASTYVGASNSSRDLNQNYFDKFDNASTSKLIPTKQGDDFDNDVVGYRLPNATMTKDNRFTAIDGQTIDDGKVIADAGETTATAKKTETVAVVDIEKHASETAAKESKKKAIQLLSVGKDFNKRVVNSLGDLVEYIRSINTNGRFKLDVVDRNLVVKIDGGRCARVEWSNFHGLIGFGKRHVMCILCKKIDRDMQKHILSQCHVDKLTSPIDKNFIREMDNDKGHCILCNDTIENPDVHALCNKEHEAKLKLSLITEELDAFEILESTGQSAKSTVTERKEPTTNDPVRYQSGDANEVRMICSVKEPRVTKEDEKPDISLENESANKELKVGASVGNEPTVSVVGGNIDEVVCNICFVSVNSDDIQSHEQTPEHKSNEGLAIHHLLEYSPTYLTLKCKVCLTGFPVHLKAEHISSPFHQNSYKKLLAAHTMTRSAHSVFCSTCVAYIMIGDELAHITSKTHITLTVNVLACTESETAAAHAKANERHYCTTCSRYVPGDAKNLKMHENGARHVKNLAALKATEGKVGSTSKTQAPKVAIVSLKAIVPNPKSDLPIPKTVVPTSKSDVPIPKAVVTTSKLDVPIPKAVEPTPKADVPIPKSVVSTSKSDVPIPKAVVPTPKLEVPIPKAVVPTSKSDVPIPKAVVPTPKLEVLIPIAVVPTSKSDVPIPKAVLRFSKLVVSTQEAVAPTPKAVAPTTKAVLPTPNADAVSKPVVPSPKASIALYGANDLKELMLTSILKDHLPLIRLKPNLAEVQCKICSTSLSNTPDIIQRHLDTYAHTNNLTKLDKGGLWFYHDVYWCNACDVCVPFDWQFQHISDSQHEENVTKLKEEENKGTRDFSKCPDRFDLNVLKSIGDQSSIRCQVCEVVVPVSGSTLRMHFAGRKHRSEAQLAPLLATHGLRDAGREFECTACRCYIPKSSLFQHVTKPHHLFHIIAAGAANPKISTGTDIDVESKSSQKQRGVEGESNSGQKKGVEDTRRGQLETESGEKGQLEEVEATTNNDQAQEQVKAMTNDQQKINQGQFCGVCDVQLTKSEANVSLHNDGARHIGNLKLMVQNRVRVVDEGCYCEACDITFARNHLHQHVATMQHLVMLG